MRTRILSVAVVAVLLLAGGPAAATVFCGGNGLVKLSFSAGPELQPVAEVAAGQDGVTSVQVWAVLDEVVPVEGPLGALLALGGFELGLQVQGAEATVVEKVIDMPFRDFAESKALCRVGTVPGEPFVDGRLVLCHWTVLLKGEVRNVRFSLDPEGMPSCDGIEDCAGSGASAVYAGAIDAGQENHLFAAGQVPAYLNPEGTPDILPEPCYVDFREVGIYTERQLRK
jgi:hypothetical protein